MRWGYAHLRISPRTYVHSHGTRTRIHICGTTMPQYVAIKLRKYSGSDAIWYTLSLCSGIYVILIRQGKSEGFDSRDCPSNLKLDSNRQFLRPCDREIWWMTSKNNRALLLYYVKFCASFQIYWWIQTEFTVQKRSIRVEIGDTLSHVTLKSDRWPWNK